MSGNGQGTNLPALSGDLVSKLMGGIAKTQAQTVVGGGQPLLRFIDGDWVFGQSNEPVQEGSSWAVNPLSLEQGWICWPDPEAGGPRKPIGEVKASMIEDMPVCPQPIQGRKYEALRCAQLKCLDGDDAGVEVTFKTNSLGGVSAFDRLIGAIRTQLGLDPTHPCAVVQLTGGSYQNKKYGKQIATPELEVIGWADMHGQDIQPHGDSLPKIAVAETLGKTAAAAAPAASAKKSKASLKEAEPPFEPSSTAQVKAGAGAAPRRRPAGR